MLFLITSELLYCEFHCTMAPSKKNIKCVIFCYVRFIPSSLIPAELGAFGRRGAFCPEVSINQSGQNERGGGIKNKGRTECGVASVAAGGL